MNEQNQYDIALARAPGAAIPPTRATYLEQAEQKAQALVTVLEQLWEATPVASTRIEIDMVRRTMIAIRLAKELEHQVAEMRAEMVK